MRTMTKEEYDNYYNIYDNNVVKLEKLKEKYKNTISLLDAAEYISKIHLIKSLLNGTASNKNKILNTIKHCQRKFDIVTYSIVGDWGDLVITFKDKDTVEDVIDFT